MVYLYYVIARQLLMSKIWHQLERKFQSYVWYGAYRGVPAVYTAGITGIGHFGRFGTASIPVPET